MKERNAIKFAYIPECFNITVTVGSSVKHYFPEHFHNSYSIGVITEGALLIKITEEIELHKHFVYLLNPEDVHSLRNMDIRGYSYAVISIPESEITGIYGKEKMRFTQSYIKEPQLGLKVINTANAIISKNTMLLEKQELIMALLEQMDFSIDECVYKASIEASLVFIKENYKNNINIKQLADISYMSLYHYIREFKKYTGMSPFKHMIQLRLKEARRLLLEGREIAEVSIETGFYDQSHFIKYFKSYMGITPGIFVKTIRTDRSKLTSVNPEQV